MTRRPGPAILVETGLALGWASARLRLQPFETLMASMTARPAVRGPVEREDAAMLARALRAWDRRLPWRTMCFEQGLAAMRILRRRGHEATLHYGARGAGDMLEAHVWVTSGDVPLVGCEIAAEFRELRRFPAD